MFLLKKTPIIFLLLVLIFFSSSLKAETEEVLTFEDCRREAGTNNPDLIAAQELVNRAKADYKRSYADFFPQISASLGYTAANSAILGPQSLDSPTNQGIQQQISVGPVFQENLFSGFKNIGALQKSRADITAAEANLDAVKAQISFDLKTSFYKLLYQQKLAQLNENIFQRRKQNLKLVELRFEVGRENKGSYMRNDAFASQAAFDVLQTRQNIQAAISELAKVLGRNNPGAAPIYVKGDFKVNPPLLTPDFEALTAQSPIQLQAKAESDSAKSTVRVTKSLLYPSVDTTASFARIRNNFETDLERWSAGANISYPFLGLGRSYYDIQSAKANHRRSLELLRSSKNQIYADLKRAHADFLNAIEGLKVQEKFVKAAETRAEIGRSQYANGLLSFQDWDILENDLINSQKTFLSSLNNLVLAEAAWERTQGKGTLR